MTLHRPETGNRNQTETVKARPDSRFVAVQSIGGRGGNASLEVTPATVQWAMNAALWLFYVLRSSLNGSPTDRPEATESAAPDLVYAKISSETAKVPVSYRTVVIAGRPYLTWGIPARMP